MDFKELLNKIDTLNNRQVLLETDIGYQSHATRIPPKYVNNNVLNQYFNEASERLNQEQLKRKTALNHKAKAITKKIMAESYGEQSDPIDLVTLDVPLLIRLLEYAREDAKTDMDLHDVADNLIKLSKQHESLTMDHYNLIVKSPNGEDYGS